MGGNVYDLFLVRVLLCQLGGEPLPFLLRPLALRDIPCYPDYLDRPLPAYGRGRVFNIDDVAALALGPDSAVEMAVLPYACSDSLRHLGQADVVGHEEVRHLPDKFLPGISKHIFDPVVRPGHHAVAVPEDCIGDVAQQGGVLPFRLAKRQLGGPLLCHVNERCDRLYRCALPVFDNAGERPDVEFAAVFPPGSDFPFPRTRLHHGRGNIVCEGPVLHIHQFPEALAEKVFLLRAP